MRISILQTDIVWENKQENLRRLREKLETLRGTTEIVVLPETFSTGFSMDTSSLAEPTTGETITTLRRWSEEYNSLLQAAILPAKQPRKEEIPPTTTVHSSLRPKAMPTITTNDTSSGWDTKQSISLPAANVPLSSIAAGTYCCLYVMTSASQFGAAISTANTTFLFMLPTGPFPAGKSGTFCCKHVLWKISVMSAVSTVSAETAETFHTAEAVWSTLRRGKCLPLYPTTKRQLPPPPSAFPPCRSSG